MKLWHVITISAWYIHGSPVSGREGMTLARTDCTEVGNASEIVFHMALRRSLDACYSFRNHSCALTACSSTTVLSASVSDHVTPRVHYVTNYILLSMQYIVICVVPCDSAKRAMRWP